MKIFRELPSYGRVSLVNKLFYDVACSVNDSKICVKFLINSNWLVSKTLFLCIKYSIMCLINIIFNDRKVRNINQ